MRRILVALSGASGQVYGRRLLEVLACMSDVELHLIISSAARDIITHELGPGSTETLEGMARYVHDSTDLSAAPASGSCLLDSMIIAPCSIKTLSAVAHSHAQNLITRAADVMLKERRALVLMVRETPLHLGHIRNMARVAEMGGILLPPIPAFYHLPRTISDIVDHSVGKTLDVLRIPHQLFKRWDGLSAG